MYYYFIINFHLVNFLINFLQLETEVIPYPHDTTYNNIDDQYLGEDSSEYDDTLPPKHTYDMHTNTTSTSSESLDMDPGLMQNGIHQLVPNGHIGVVSGKPESLGRSTGRIMSWGSDDSSNSGGVQPFPSLTRVSVLFTR